MMKNLIVLIPKLRPPFVSDIVNFQMNNIIDKLKENYNVKVIWVVFAPNKIQEVKEISYDVLDYHNYDNALEILNTTNPDLILMEGIFGITGITFVKSAKHKKIKTVTIFPPGILPYSKSYSGIKRRFSLIFSHNILGDLQNSPNQKFGMLKYFLKRYFFLLKTLRCLNYSMYDLFKFIMFYPASQIFSRQVESIHSICSGDLNFVGTDHLRQSLIDLGYDSATVFVTGDPSFDHMIFDAQKYRLVEKTQKEQITKNKSKFKILFCTSPMHEHGAWSKKAEDSLILNVINKISESKNFQISIKIHPTSSSKEEYVQLLENIHSDITLYQKENILELIDNHDLMIVYGASSVVLYGIILKKPIVMLNFSNLPSTYNFFIDKNIMSICDDISKLFSLLNHSLSTKISDDVYQNYLQNQLGNMDGKSSEKIVKKIKEYL